MKILVTESAPNARYGKWLHYSIVKDEEVTLIEMTPATSDGWKVKRITVFAGDNWRGYSCDQIVKDKLFYHNDIKEVTDETRIANVSRLLTLGHEVFTQK